MLLWEPEPSHTIEITYKIFTILSSTTNTTSAGSGLLSSKKNNNILTTGGGVKRSANSVAVLSNASNQTSSIIYSSYTNSLNNPSLTGLQSLTFLDCPISAKRIATSNNNNINNNNSIIPTTTATTNNIQSTIGISSPPNNSLHFCHHNQTTNNNSNNLGSRNSSILINTFHPIPFSISNTIPTTNTTCDIISNNINCCGNNIINSTLTTPSSTTNNTTNSNTNLIQGIGGGAVLPPPNIQQQQPSNSLTSPTLYNSRHSTNINSTIKTNNNIIMGKNNGTGSYSKENSNNNYDQQNQEISHLINNNNIDNNHSIDMGSKREEECQSTGSQQQQTPHNSNCNTVLRVIFGNISMAISLDVIYTCFSRFGNVLRIITFTKNNIYQALVQLSDNKSAETAFNQLDGKILIPGCNPLKIEYSKLTTLNIKYNNEKSRDYTKPHLPAGDFIFDPNFLQMAGKNLSHQQIQPVNNLTNTTPYTIQYPNVSNLNNGTILTANGLQYTTIPQNLTSLNPYLQQLANNTNNGIVKTTTNNVSPNSLMTTNQQLQSVFTFPQLGVITLPSPVVLVTNLDSKKINPDILFTLFGVYGDVQRVKILYNQRSQALIEFSEPQQALLAVKHLDNTRWNGNYMRVSPSKYSSVQIRLDGKQDETSTKDYTHSPLHRFRKPGSKNYMNIYPPNSTLHLSNIPITICEKFLIQAFESKGFVVKAFKFFPNNHKMALIQLDTIEAGINSLIVMHNFRLAENAHLKVSFSKSVLKPNLVL